MWTRELKGIYEFLLVSSVFPLSVFALSLNSSAMTRSFSWKDLKLPVQIPHPTQTRFKFPPAGKNDNQISLCCQGDIEASNWLADNSHIINLIAAVEQKVSEPGEISFSFFYPVALLRFFKYSSQSGAQLKAKAIQLLMEHLTWHWP